MSDVTSTVDMYLEMWNETDPARRAQHIAQAWTDDGRYVDPQLQAEGHAALRDMVSAVQSKFPGHRFRRVSGVDVHHDHVRFAWEFAAPSGAILVAGLDVGVVAEDGRLQYITGFFGDLPAK